MWPRGAKCPGNQRIDAARLQLRGSGDRVWSAAGEALAEQCVGQRGDNGGWIGGRHRGINLALPEVITADRDQSSGSAVWAWRRQAGRSAQRRQQSAFVKTRDVHQRGSALPWRRSGKLLGCAPECQDGLGLI